MDSTLSNSFFYFFSATPQVLGGIMALFAVFVIFKIQALSEILKKRANELYEYVATPITDGDFDMIQLRDDIRRELRESYEDDFGNSIYKILQWDEENITRQSAMFMISRQEYIWNYEMKQTLVKTTIRISKITAFIIILCLGILPFGKFVICHPVLLWIIFGLVLVGVGVIFNRLLSILKKSFA